MIYLFAQALEQVHEYEADEEVSTIVGSTSYANLLLTIAVRKNAPSLLHSFVKNPIKLRIEMLFTNQSKNMRKLMYLLALPIGLGLTWLFAVQVVYAASEANGRGKPFTLVLDAAHGGSSSGFEINGYKEKDLTLLMSKKIKAMAEAWGIKVLVTRDKDVAVTLDNRVKVQGDFFLSLHVNTAEKNSGANGIRMVVEEIGADKLKGLKSGSMTYHLYKNLKNVNGIYTDNKPNYVKSSFVLKNNPGPGVLLELGYITNKNDRNFITSAEKQNELAAAIVQSVLQYKKALKPDEEMVKLIQEANKSSRDYMDWKNSEKYRKLNSEAQRINNRRVSGKIEALHYFGINKKLDGLILNASGKRYRVYIHPNEAAGLELNVGDAFSVSAAKAEVWYDSDYPVIVVNRISQR